MSQFKQCVSKTACTEDGDHCRSCGRPHWQINQTRQFIEAISQFVMDAEYDNVDEFTQYLVNKIQKKVAYRRKQ